MMEFKFPDVGEGITEGQLVTWNVKVGDEVKEDDTLAEVETDKAVVEIPSPCDGTIVELMAKEGDTIVVGEVMVKIGDVSEVAEAEADSIQAEEKPKSTGVVGQLEEAPEDEEEKKLPQKEVTESTEPEVLAMPGVRKMATDLNVELSKVKGTGNNGQITEDDVKALGGEKKVSSTEKKEGPKVTKKYDMFGYVERKPVKGVRKAVADHMVQSAHAIPHVTHMDEVDMTELVALRKRENELLEKEGVHLTFMPFVIKAVIAALDEYPEFNASFDEENEEIVIKKYFNIGFAVDTPEGLMVPVIKGAQEKSIVDISGEIVQLAEKARDRKIDLMDMKGSSFTITNIGSIGGEFATPVINYPESAILGLGKIQDKPVAREGEVVIRKMMGLSLAFDHRVADGANAARFVNSIIAHLEDPGRLLVDM